jgi:hypothetical protein
MDNNITLPAWYESTSGPKISATLSGIAINLIPIINIVSMAYGHALPLVPQVISFWISILVFVGVSIRTAFGYIRAKKILGAQIERLKSDRDALASQLAGQC